MSEGVIERVTAPSEAEFVAKYLRSGTPVILTDVVTKWPAFERWTPDYLASATAARTFPIAHSPDGTFTTNDRKAMTFRELVDAPADARYYAQCVNLGEELPDLARDVRIPGYFDMKRFNNGALWFGRKTTTPIHWHPRTEVFLCQVYGTKRFTLFSPDQYQQLQPRPWNVDDFNGSETSYTGDTGPLEKATAIRCTLQPGDMIYIPIHWWHLVEADDWSISVVFEWLADGRSRRFWPQTLRRWSILAAHLPSVVAARVSSWISPTDAARPYPVQRF